MKSGNGIYFYNICLLNEDLKYTTLDSNTKMVIFQPNLNLSPYVALLLTNLA